MNNNKFKKIKEDYLETAIPEELEDILNKTLKECGVNMTKNKSPFKKFKVATATVVASAMLFTVGINASPVFAQSMLKLPLIGGIVEVMTFREYKIDDGTFNANLEAPAISGLGNKELQNSLNEKYLKDNEILYTQFQAEMEEMKEKNQGNEGHLGVDSGFVIKTDNEQILAIGRYVVNTVASSSTKFKYDTIDKKKEILLNLPSLFKDESYVELISANIKNQMLKENSLDENKIYWTKGIGDEGFANIFEKISPEQSFYINNDNKLVISFDKYEVAPGYMGVLEFIIPTESINDVLVGNEYIK